MMSPPSPLAVVAVGFGAEEWGEKITKLVCPSLLLGLALRKSSHLVVEYKSEYRVDTRPSCSIGVWISD